MKIYAIIKFSKEGLHYYIDAPDEVAFLRSPHRHMFHMTVKIEQFHDDRDIEFILAKRYLDSVFDFKEVSHKSCEQIAEDIIQRVKQRYGENREISVSVFEDDENGAEVST